MAATATNLPVQTEDKQSETRAPAPWAAFDNLRREVDRLFDQFDGGLFRPSRAPFALEPFWRRGTSLVTLPAIDVVERDDAFEVTAELPGLTGKDIDVAVRNGTLTIKGEKQDSKEETKKDYYVRERQYGSFERALRLSDQVDANMVEATFKDGLLTVRLPKKPEAQKAATRIEVKAG